MLQFIRNIIYVLIYHILNFSRIRKKVTKKHVVILGKLTQKKDDWLLEQLKYRAVLKLKKIKKNQYLYLENLTKKEWC